MKLPVWAWAVIVTGAVFLLAVATGVAFLVTTAAKVGDALSSDTGASIQLKPAADGRPAFALRYGKDVVALSALVVRDAGGAEVWKVEGFGETKPADLVYGVVPAGAKQVVPADGPPPDVRGKRITVEASCRFRVSMGMGHQSSFAEFDVP